MDRKALTDGTEPNSPAKNCVEATSVAVLLLPLPKVDIVQVSCVAAAVLKVRASAELFEEGFKKDAADWAAPKTKGCC